MMTPGYSSCDSSNEDNDPIIVALYLAQQETCLARE